MAKGLVFMGKADVVRKPSQRSSNRSISGVIYKRDGHVESRSIVGWVIGVGLPFGEMEMWDGDMTIFAEFS
jgi:hypothetical protein